MLEQLRVMDEENERKAREDEKAREEYRERKVREKAEREEKEEEERRLKREEQEREEEERKNVEEREQQAEEGDKEVGEEPKGEQAQEQGETDSSPEGREGGPVAKPASAPRPPPPQPQSDDLSSGLKALQLSSATANPAVPARAPNAGGGAKINFSEFEAESDPFDSMELKTINELQELAAVLQKTTTAAAHEPSVVQSVSTATAGAPPNFHQHQFHQQPYPPAQQV